MEGSEGLFPTCRESKDEVNLFLGSVGAAMRPLTAALVAAGWVDFKAEGDASSASYFLVGTEVAVGTITVIGCGTSSLQGDVKLHGQKTASQLPGLHEILLVGKCCKALISI